MPESKPPIIVCDAAELTEADVATVEALARLALYARRLGASLRVEGAPVELRDLIAFIGLAEVIVAEPEAVRVNRGGRSGTDASVAAPWKRR